MLDGIIPLAMIGQVQKELAAMSNGFNVKGIVATAADLPDSGEMGDLYMVSSEGYASYVWTGSGWGKKTDGYGNIASFNVTAVTS